MSYFDARYGLIIDSKKFGSPRRSHLNGLEKGDMLGYALMDRLIEAGCRVEELSQLYSEFVSPPLYDYFSESEMKTVGNVWDTIFLNGHRNQILLWQLSDYLTDAVRGTLHPNRILGRLLDGNGNS